MQRWNDGRKIDGKKEGRNLWLDGMKPNGKEWRN